jgi:hypothetical protein
MPIAIACPSCGGRSLRLFGRTHGVQPAHETIGNERDFLGQGQGSLKAVEPEQAFPGGERRDAQPLAEDLPAVRLRLEHEPCGQGQVEALK